MKSVFKNSQYQIEYYPDLIFCFSPKGNLTELKSFGSPPPAVINVTGAVMVLLAPNGKIPKDRSWLKAKNMMSKVDPFLESLIAYDKEHIHPNIITAIGMKSLFRNQRFMLDEMTCHIFWFSYIKILQFLKRFARSFHQA